MVPSKFVGADCQKKWINIRDQYNKTKNKKLGTGSSAEMKKRRNEIMAFLDEIVVTNKRFEEHHFILMIIFKYADFCSSEQRQILILQTKM